MLQKIIFIRLLVELNHFLLLDLKHDFDRNLQTVIINTLFVVAGHW